MTENQDRSADARRFMEANQELWDEWTDIHESSDFYDLQSFIRGDENPDERRGPPGVRLRNYEIAEVGDVTGKDLLHLQCHFGIDTLSWARLGARVTGADFSPKAVALARKVAGQIGIEAKFVQANVYDLPEVLEGEFDIVYTSRGALPWLPDIQRWARVAAHFVRPGGFLYVTEAHPVLWVFDDENVEVGELRPKFPYFSHDEPITFPTEGSYADRAAEIKSPYEYGWNHGLGEVVTALVDAGLTIESLKEFPFVDWKWPFLEEWEDGTYRLPKATGAELPLFFSLKATKAA
ncbi:MAG: class I SAM-dependent methyltransferase [Actinomycetota bacterium]